MIGVSLYKLVLSGDVVVNKMKAWQGSIAVSKHQGIVSGDYLVCSVADSVSRPFLHHLLRSNSLVNEYAIRSKGVRPSQWRLYWDDLADIEVEIPSLSVQHVIADYLDTETSRIDTLIERKRRMVDLLEERASLALAASMKGYGFVFPAELDPQWSEVSLPDGWTVLHLNQTLLQLTNGFVGPTRDILFDDGVRYVQSLHIKRGAIDFDRRPFYVAKDWHDARPRVHLRPEDVLIVQTGDVGQVAVVPADFGEASCHALQIARVRPEAVSGSYLAEYLRTPFAYHSLLKRATGALHPHLEGGIRDVPVVVPPRAVQDALVNEASSRRREAEKMIDRLADQIDLIVEHRQTLITAAVTGQLAIPGLAA